VGQRQPWDGGLPAPEHESYAFEAAFPGETFEAALVGFESTREAGITRRGEYAVELVAGQAI